MRPRGWCWPWSSITRSDMVNVWHTNISNSPKNPENRNKVIISNIILQRITSDFVILRCCVDTVNSLVYLFFTSRILRTNEDVGCLGQPLHELGNAFRVVLGLAQRAHHATQDTTDNSCEQLWVEGFSCTRGCLCGVRCGVGPCGVSGTGGRWGWREDWLGGLEIKRK